MSLASRYLTSHPLNEYAGIKELTVATTVNAFLDSETSNVWVAEHDSKIVGFLGAALYPLFFNADVSLAVEMGFFVEEAYRTCGYGDGLRLHFESWAQQKNAIGTLVCAPVGATAVETFYEKAGYVPLETQFIKRMKPWGE